MTQGIERGKMFGSSTFRVDLEF